MPAKWQMWMPKVIDAWCGSRNVQGLTDAAYRAYDNLLMAEWQSEDGMLPDDDRVLAKASGMFSRWQDVKSEVLEMFQSSEGRLFSPRLLAEWHRAQTVHKGKKTRSGDSDESGTERTLFENNQKPFAIRSHTTTATTTSTDTTTQNGAFALPGWVCRDSWDGYEEMRRKIRKPLTDRARTLALSELGKLRALGCDPAAVLNQSTLNAWQGLFELRSNGNGHKPWQQPQTKPVTLAEKRLRMVQ